MSGRNRVETGKEPDANPFGVYPVLYGFYLVYNFILRDLSGYSLADPVERIIRVFSDRSLTSHYYG